jgi:RecJ-like exonuclease
MKRRNFLAALPAAAALGGCARMEQRAQRYEASECPFCSVNPGVCSYCNGDTKCTFCNGTGTRTTVTPHLPEEGVKGSEYTEECPYCSGSGTCRYCKGAGTCWACDGSGTVSDWDFYEKYQKITGGKS